MRCRSRRLTGTHRGCRHAFAALMMIAAMAGAGRFDPQTLQKIMGVRRSPPPTTATGT
jgi:hypothetical protein